jgi:hypothetical protein
MGVLADAMLDFKQVLYLSDIYPLTNPSVFGITPLKAQATLKFDRNTGLPISEA